MCKFCFLLIIFLGIISLNFISADISVNANIIGNNHPNIPILIPQSNASDINSVNLRWQLVSDLEDNNVIYFLRMYSSLIFEGSKNELFFTDFNTYDNFLNDILVPSGNIYYWAVKACDNYYGDYNNCSAYSLEDSFTIYTQEQSSSNTGGGSGSSNVVIYGCKDLKGKICSKTQLCSEDIVATYDSDVCCFGQCINESDLGKTIDVNKVDVYRNLNPTTNNILQTSDLLFERIETNNKRFALENEIDYIFKLETKGIVGINGVSEYKNIITIDIKNITKTDLSDIDLIVEIPKEFASSYDFLNSDYTHAVLSSSPIILRFYFNEIKVGESATVNYYFNTNVDNEGIIEQVFLSLNEPTLIFKMINLDPCLNVKCKSLNPCSISYCSEGECLSINKQDNLLCENNKVCINGLCESTKDVQETRSYFKFNIYFYIVLGIVLVLLMIFILFYLIDKRKKFEELSFVNNKL